MGFWIYMLIMTSLIPLLMIIFGRHFSKKAPDMINHVFGYCTPRSMKNMDTWTFAHKYCGKIWTVTGWILLPCSVIIMLLCAGRSRDTAGYIGGAIEIVQVIFLAGSVVPVEKALKRTFDKDGKRIHP